MDGGAREMDTECCMTDLSYRECFHADDFLAPAQRVWPHEYVLPDAAAVLERTIDIGAWDGAEAGDT